VACGFEYHVFSGCTGLTAANQILAGSAYIFCVMKNMIALVRVEKMSGINNEVLFTKKRGRCYFR
jgi:hypothetical protein